MQRTASSHSSWLAWMTLRWLGILALLFRLLDYGPNHKSVEPNRDEHKKAHFVTVISFRFAMVSCVDVVH